MAELDDHENEPVGGVNDQKHRSNARLTYFVLLMFGHCDKTFKTKLRLGFSLFSLSLKNLSFYTILFTFFLTNDFLHS